MNFKKLTLVFLLLINISPISFAREQHTYVCPTADQFKGSGTNWSVDIVKDGKRETITYPPGNTSWGLNKTFIREVKGNPQKATSFSTDSGLSWVICSYGYTNESNFAQINIGVKKESEGRWCSMSGHTITCAW